MPSAPRDGVDIACSPPHCEHGQHAKKHVSVLDMPNATRELGIGRFSPFHGCDLLGDYFAQKESWMSRQIELYRKVATDYDRMALLIKDQRLRNMFMGFAQQWREAALEANAVDLLDQVKH